ncbi:MAG: hypothetical protein HXY53_06070 [Nitrospirae bacterium]|nr:hypothetical protein [Nitrospirota bacterium]
MTVLEILQNNRKTEVIFKKYEAQTGKCILCSHLFDPIKVITEKYDLDLEKFLKDLEASIVEF